MSRTTAGSPPRAASGSAEGAGAVSTAVSTAVLGLHGRPPGLVVLFPDADLPWPDVVAQAVVAAPGARLAGMTSAGLITRSGVGGRGCAAIAFGEDVDVGVGLAHDASRDMRGAGRAAAEQALRDLDPVPGHTVMLLFVDPTSGDEAAAIDGAYSVTGARMPLAGGGANGGPPAVIRDREMCGDAVVAVAVCSPDPIAVGSGDGCRPYGPPAIATRTDGRVVLELNGVEAERVYLEALGHGDARMDDEAFEAFAVVHPLAQPELGGSLRLRHVIGRAPGGGLRCATRIPPNAAVWFTEQTDETILRSARAVVGTTLTELGRMPQAVLVFDCAARKRALGAGLAEAGRVMLEEMDGVAAVAGLYTRGEVARTRGAKGDRNHAIVVVGFC